MRAVHPVVHYPATYTALPALPSSSFRLFSPLLSATYHPPRFILPPLMPRVLVDRSCSILLPPLANNISSQEYSFLFSRSLAVYTYLYPVSLSNRNNPERKNSKRKFLETLKNDRQRSKHRKQPKKGEIIREKGPSIIVALVGDDGGFSVGRACGYKRLFRKTSRWRERRCGTNEPRTAESGFEPDERRRSERNDA